MGAPLLAAALCAAPLAAQAPDSTVDDLAGLDIDELANVRVTSAARRPEPISEATAAITVLTREDIRRSGAATLPQVLRAVPGLQVARVGGREWAISARGFNEQSSNKLLLLVDGRTVYSPIFAGVYWDVVSVPIDEIDRIEVIRGPGGALWGANAVNGVINIITRSAAESAGGRLALAGGTWDHAFGSLRYGGDLGGGTAYRAHVSGRRRDAAQLLDGSDGFDDWGFGQAGFRLDGGAGGPSEWMVQGEAYLGGGDSRVVVPAPERAPFNEVLIDETRVRGGDVLGRWVRRSDAGYEIAVQAYYSHAHREQEAVFGTSTEHTVDLDLQQRLPILRGHDFVWGLGYRLLRDEVTGGRAYGFDPSERTSHLFTAFVQDEIALVPQRLALTLGSKIEHNSYTGVELQPTLRLLWSPSARHSIWAAASRAVRTPSRIDLDAVAISAAPEPRFDARLVGNEDFEAERLWAYELGYRVQPHARLSLDLALFYNDYDRLRTLAPDTFFLAEPRPIVLVDLRNLGSGHTAGVELAATWRAAPWMRLRGTYAFLDSEATLDAGAPPGSAVDGATSNNAEHEAGLWVSFDLPQGVELDLVGRYVGALEGPGIPEYVSADARIGWRLGRELELSIAGQDLLRSRHREFGTSPFVADPRAIERRGYAKVVWRF